MRTRAAKPRPLVGHPLLPAVKAWQPVLRLDAYVLSRLPEGHRQSPCIPRAVDMRKSRACKRAAWKPQSSTNERRTECYQDLAEFEGLPAQAVLKTFTTARSRTERPAQKLTSMFTTTSARDCGLRFAVCCVGSTAGTRLGRIKRAEAGRTRRANSMGRESNTVERTAKVRASHPTRTSGRTS